MSWQASEHVRSLRGISPTEKALLFALADRHSTDNKGCWPRLKLLADDAGVDESTARRNLRKLENKGILAITMRRREDGSATSSFYQFALLDVGADCRGVGADCGEVVGTAPPLESPRESPKESPIEEEPAKRVGDLKRRWVEFLGSYGSAFAASPIRVPEAFATAAARAHSEPPLDGDGLYTLRWVAEAVATGQPWRVTLPPLDQAAEAVRYWKSFLWYIPLDQQREAIVRAFKALAKFDHETAMVDIINDLDATRVLREYLDPQPINV